MRFRTFEAIFWGVLKKCKFGIRFNINIFNNKYIFLTEDEALVGNQFFAHKRIMVKRFRNKLCESVKL